MKILVAGSAGQVATALAERALPRGIDLKRFGRTDLDLETRRGADLVRAFRPDAIINAAAYTAVDKAESEPDRAMAINRDGAAWLASLAHGLAIPFLHLSTDYVFNGAKEAPYVETDATDPQSAYGRSKFAGEQAVRDVCPMASIFRTAWVYSPFGNNFVKTMLRLSRERDSLSVVDDQIGNPTSAHDLAEGLLTIAMQMTAKPLGVDAGLYHMTGTGETSWCGFARAIVGLGTAAGGRNVPVKAIATAAYPTPAPRPANSRLDCTKLFETFGVRLPPWQDGLARTLEYFRTAETTR